MLLRLPFDPLQFPLLFFWIGWSCLEELQQLEYIDEFEPGENIPTWEYEVLKLKSDSLESSREYNKTLLNGMGEKGWELVRITSMGDSKSDNFGVFKRSWSDKVED